MTDNLKDREAFEAALSKNSDVRFWNTTDAMFWAWRAAIDAALAARGAVPAGWVPLTDDDRRAAFESLPDMLDGFLKTWGWLHFANAIEKRCREKNAAAPQQVAQPMTDAQKLATAIAEAATKVGITDASIHSFSGPQLLMLLDDMVEMAQAKPEQEAQPSEPMLDCDVVPRPLSYPLKDYHHSTTDGPLHSTWKDKPHRIVYDLIAAVRFYSQAKPEQAAQPTELVRYGGRCEKHLRPHPCPQCLVDHTSLVFAERVISAAAPQKPKG